MGIKEIFERLKHEENKKYLEGEGWKKQLAQEEIDGKRHLEQRTMQIFEESNVLALLEQANLELSLNGQVETNIEERAGRLRWQGGAVFVFAGYYTDDLTVRGSEYQTLEKREWKIQINLEAALAKAILHPGSNSDGWDYNLEDRSSIGGIS